MLSIYHEYYLNLSDHMNPTLLKRKPRVTEVLWPATKLHSKWQSWYGTQVYLDSTTPVLIQCDKWKAGIVRSCFLFRGSDIINTNETGMNGRVLPLRSRDRKKMVTLWLFPSLYSHFAFCLETLWEQARPVYLYCSQLELRNRQGRGNACSLPGEAWIQPGQAQETRTASQLDPF